MKPTIAVLAASMLLSASIPAQVPQPVGEQFQVNSYTTISQNESEVAADAQGNFVVVWESIGSAFTDTSENSIQMQRYHASGALRGGEFQVNSYTTSFQRNPDVAADAQGNFVVVWQSSGSNGTDTSQNSIQAQRFDNFGNPRGGQFQVNSYITNGQGFPLVVADPLGNFVVAWQSYGSYDNDSSSSSIQAQRYDANGTPQSGQFQVNSYTTGSQFGVAAAADAQGNFVVVWGSYGSQDTDTSGPSAQAQRFDSLGNPQGGQFQVNSYTTGSQYGVAVAMTPQGGFVVAWDSFGSYGTDVSSSSVQAQRYDANGAPIGGEFQINTYTPSYQSGGAATFLPGGDFVVVWSSYGSFGTDTIDSSIQAQYFDASGIPVGSQFQVNTYTSYYQPGAKVASSFQGDFVVVWDSFGSYGTDNYAFSVQGQRFAIPIFVGGFESGDFGDWIVFPPPVP